MLIFGYKRHVHWVQIVQYFIQNVEKYRKSRITFWSDCCHSGTIHKEPQHRGRLELNQTGIGSLSILLYLYILLSQGATGFESEKFLKIGDGYYYFDRKTKMNWFQASESCRRMNSSLVTFETVEEYNGIQRLMEILTDDLLYWTSGNALGDNSTHIWHSTGKPIDVNIWAANQPDNQQDKERCDLMNYRANPEDLLGLNDANCNYLQNHICEAEHPYTVSFVVWE